MLVSQFKSLPKQPNVATIALLYNDFAFAIRDHNLEKTIHYLEAGLDPTKRFYTDGSSQQKLSALHLACHCGFIAGVTKLILKTAKNDDLNKNIFGECILIAAKLNNAEIIGEFINCTLNPEITSKDVNYLNYTAMDFARLHKNEQMQFNLRILGYTFPTLAQQEQEAKDKKLRQQQCIINLNNI